MRRKSIALGGLALLVILSGCASLSVHSSVTADGTISQYKMELNTSSMVYGMLEEEANGGGYDTVEDYYVSDFNDSSFGSISYDEEFDGNDVTMTLGIEDFDPPEDSSISVTESDGSITYEDETFVNESADVTESQEEYMSSVTVNYYLTMPGEITDSNADEVDGDTAEWHENGPEAFVNNPIYAESETGSLLGVPGFGIGITALSLLVAGLFAAVRYR